MKTLKIIELNKLEINNLDGIKEYALFRTCLSNSDNLSYLYSETKDRFVFIDVIKSKNDISVIDKDQNKIIAIIKK